MEPPHVQGMEDARAALGRESAKVLRLEAEAAEMHKKLALAAEEGKELVALRRQVGVCAPFVGLQQVYEGAVKQCPTKHICIRPAQPRKCTCPVCPVSVPVPALCTP